MIEFSGSAGKHWIQILNVRPWEVSFQRRGMVRIQGEIYQEWSPEFQEAFEAEREREKTWEALTSD